MPSRISRQFDPVIGDLRELSYKL